MYVFNFHRVTAELRAQDDRNITLTQKSLRQFIRVIRRLGMKTVSMKEVIANGGPQEPASDRQVVLTFDDGYENFYHHAAPVLVQENCPATVFVLPGKFSGTNDWDLGHLPIEEQDRLMSLEQMQELEKTGIISFGSHGLYHRHLPQLSEREIREELCDSYEILSKELKTSFLSLFAYPWGEYSEQVLRLMDTSPYPWAFTTEKGEWLANQAPYTIPRFPTSHKDSYFFFLLARLGYNWFTSLDFAKRGEHRPVHPQRKL